METLRTLIINLERRVDRRKDMETQVSKHPFLDVQYIKAIDGATLQHFPQRLNSANKYACVLSHLKAIEMAKYQKLDKVLVLEDDVILCEDLQERIDLAMYHMPEDWAMLYLGYFPMPKIYPEPARYSESLVKLHGHLGAFAYIIRDMVYDTAIRELSKFDHFADNKLSFVHTMYNCYCLDPFCVYVKTDYSDLSSNIVSYDQIKERFKERI